MKQNRINHKCDNLVKENFILKMKNNGLEPDYEITETTEQSGIL